MTVHRLALCCVLWATWAANVSITTAADLGPLANYLTDDVVAVGYLDLTKFDAAATVGELEKLGVMSDGEIANARQEAAQVQAFYDELTKRGGRRALVLLRLADVQDGGPTWLVEVAQDGDPAAVLELLTSWRDAAVAGTQTPQNALQGVLVPQAMKIDGRVIIGGTAEELAQLGQNATGSPNRPEAAAALEALLASDGGVVAFGDGDSRRVIREMFPKLPDPFAKIDGKLLADGVSWAGVTVKLPPTPTIGVTIEANSTEVASQLQEAANTGLTMLKGVAMAASVSGQAEATAALPTLRLLQPELAGTRVMMTIGDDPEDFEAFRRALAPAAVATREAAWQSQRTNNLKQIALGLLNYESAHAALPSQAIRGADGPPLLSWRVAILPYLGEDELYKQFHLDEPWDSEHNRALIATMPAVYADPSAPDLAAAGRTTYLLPAGEGMVGHGAVGTKLREVIDGTSMTILVVEATPEQAVEWTKPADWEVDLSDPLKGARRGSGERRNGVFAAAFCDGSVQMLSSAIDPRVMKSLLTIAGKETIPAGEIK